MEETLSIIKPDAVERKLENRIKNIPQNTTVISIEKQN